MARALLLLLLPLLTALLAGHGPAPAAALRCYTCAPLDTSQLKLAVRLMLRRFPICDNFRPGRPKETYIFDCPSGSNACLKTRTMRMCSVSLSKRERCEGDRCTCVTDLCNGARAGSTPAGWLAALSLGAVVVLPTKLRLW